MKLVITQIVALCILSLATFAQAEINISEEVKNMSRGDNNAFVLEVPSAELKNVEKAWEKRMREGTKEKPITKKDETLIQGSVIERISMQPMNIYSRLFETQSGVQLIAFFEDADGFISTATKPEKASGIKVVLSEFGVEVYKEAIEEELKEEEKFLNDMESDLEKLIKVQEKFYKDISENEREIGQIKDEINSNVADQERKNEEIEKQKDLIASMTNALDEQKDEAEDLLKDLEKDKKKLVKENESMHKKIDNLESDIRELERDIESNSEEQDLKRKEIVLQKEVVQVVTRRLRDID